MSTLQINHVFITVCVVHVCVTMYVCMCACVYVCVLTTMCYLVLADVCVLCVCGGGGGEENGDEIQNKLLFSIRKNKDENNEEKENQ